MPIISANSLAILQDEVDRFNAVHPIGQSVSVKLDNGERRVTTTRSEASILSGHSAVIWLDGISGCYALDRVTPLPMSEPPARPRTEAYSPDEMRSAFAAGDSVQQIYARAYRLDRSVTKNAVRAILFEEVPA